MSGDYKLNMSLISLGFIITLWLIYLIWSYFNNKNKQVRQKEYEQRIKLSNRKSRIKQSGHCFIAGSVQTILFVDENDNSITGYNETKYTLIKNGRPKEIIFERFGDIKNGIILSEEDTFDLSGNYILIVDIVFIDDNEYQSQHFHNQKHLLKIVPRIS